MSLPFYWFRVVWPEGSLAIIAVDYDEAGRIAKGIIDRSFPGHGGPILILKIDPGDLSCVYF